ncbi:hypothetical protein LTR86_001713 [Recurvomyces mirabilis]|nr:hypothetical protein LTR86_001713 [Recurvomyces mirabilis]
MASTSQSLLLALPPELRNWIYELALHLDGPILYGVACSRYDALSARQDPEVDELYRQHGDGTPGLLLTCKQVQGEARAVYYSINAFKIMAMDKDGLMPESPEDCRAPLNDFIETIGPVNATSLSNVEVFVGHTSWPHHKHNAIASSEIFRGFRSWHLSNPSKGLRVSFMLEAGYVNAPWEPVCISAVLSLGFENFQESCKHAAAVQLLRQLAKKGNMTEARAAAHGGVADFITFLGKLGKTVVRDVRRSGRQKEVC